MKYITTAVLSVLGLSAPSFAAQYHAVPALTGNANMGVNCLNAPQTQNSSGIATQCQQLILPEHPRIKAQFPVPPKHYDVVISNLDAPVFSEFDGYPMVVELSEGRCYLRNELVNTIEPQRNVLPSEFQSFSYDCSNGPEESYDTSRLFYKYMLSGSFQPQNDAHLYASTTMQMAAHYFKDLYPQQYELCPTWGGKYCLKQLQQRVGYSAEGEKYTSDWDGEFVNLAEGGSVVGQFAHASSLDIVAHEIGHALLTWNSKVLYQGDEPAAVQEAFADMTAVAARDYYLRHIDGTASNSFLQSPMAKAWLNSAEKQWWLGADFNFNGAPLRYLAEPRFDLRSVDDARDIAEVAGPHQKAGALNKFFYLLAGSPQWSIEKAYKLALKAATNCFQSHSSIAEAGLCFKSEAEFTDKDVISDLLKQVGIVSSQAELTHLQFDIERQLDELSYSVSDRRFSNNQVARFDVSVEGVPLFEWQKNNGQGSFSKVKNGRVTLPLGANLVEMVVQLSSGKTLSAARHIYSADQARCQPNLVGDAATNIAVNSEQLALTKAFEQLTLHTDLYSQDEIAISFNTPLNNRLVSVFADLDRDRVFEEGGDSNELIFTQADTTNSVVLKLQGAEQISDGPMLLRVRIDDQQQSACATANNSQVLDLKINLKQGSNLQTVDFSTQQVNEEITLTAQASGTGEYSFNWYFDGQLEASNVNTLTRALQVETQVRVDSIRDGKVVASQQKRVQPVAPLGLGIECAIEGTQCRFTSTHTNLPNTVSARYFWEFGDALNTADTRTNSDSFLFDYKTSGQFDAKLTVYLDSLNAQFTATTQINIADTRPGLNFNSEIDLQNSLRVLFSVDNIEQYQRVIWTVDQQRYEQTDFTQPWSYTFNQAGAYTVLLTVIYPDGTPKSIRKDITVEAPNLPNELEILSIDTDIKNWNIFWCTTAKVRDLTPGSDAKVNCKYAYINEIKINTNLSENSLLRHDYWIDRNQDGQFTEDEKNTNHTFVIGDRKIPVCVTAYTLEQADTSSACIAPEGGATFNFYITK